MMFAASGVSLEVPRSLQELKTRNLWHSLTFVSCREHMQPSHLPRQALAPSPGEGENEGNHFPEKP